MPTPRDLDPQFKTVNAPAGVNDNADTPEVDRNTNSSNDADRRSDDADRRSNDEVYKNGGFIVHRQQYVDGDGVAREKIHGPMPVGEWPAYEKENNL